VKLSFVTGTNVGSRLFLLEDDDTYKLFKLNNREFLVGALKEFRFSPATKRIIPKSPAFVFSESGCLNIDIIDQPGLQWMWTPPQWNVA